jgi:hypothetical protein
MDACPEYEVVFKAVRSIKSGSTVLAVFNGSISQNLNPSYIAHTPNLKGFFASAGN